MKQIRSRLWRHGEVTDDVALSDLDGYLADPDALVWLDIVHPDPDGLALLAGELGLAPQAVEDALATHERAKAMRFHSHTFVTVYGVWVESAGAEPLASRLVSSRVSAFILTRGLITVRQDDRLDMDALVQRWDDNDLIASDGVRALLYELLDEIVDGHFVAVQRIDDAIEGLEDQLFDGAGSRGEAQRSVYRLRKEIVELRRIVLPMREVVNTLARHRAEVSGPVSPELAAGYDDLYDHVLRASEWTESLSDMVTTIFETNLSLQDAHLNEVMKKLAAWAAIIAVPTAVTGWFGQNIPYPGFATAAGLVQSIVLMVLGTVGLYILFRRNRWL